MQKFSIYVDLFPVFVLSMCQGGKAGWTRQKQQVNGEVYNGPGDKYMLQVRGTSALNCKAIQVTITIHCILQLCFLVEGWGECTYCTHILSEHCFL